ncbi:head-tail adaptor Ad1 [Vibrio phage 1254]|nr:putative head-tail connector protein [Vibrio phage 168E36-1]
MTEPDFITIDQLRHQLNLAPDEGEDSMLALYCSAAEKSVRNHINREIYADGAEIPEEDITGMHICDDLIIGMLMTASSFWQTRELNSVGIEVYKVPQLVDLTIGIYRERVL